LPFADTPTGMPRVRALLTTLVCLALIPRTSLAQTTTSPAFPDTSLSLNTDSVAPLRFLAAHGRHALISGYAAGGLEIWAYPFEILNDYHVAFHVTGTTTSIDGQSILSRVTYNADSITRIYLGPGFLVRETLFVPLDEPGAILTYSVQAAHPVDIEVHATPILNLMWPASLGGQSSAWNSTLSAFVLSEPTSGYSAVVGSPDIVAHDELGNRTTQGANGAALGFTLHPSSSGDASVYIALNAPGITDPGVLVHRLVSERPAFHMEYDRHLQALRNTMLTVTTPDERVNQAIAWSELALDQAWVCNRELGCGYVAGYGPSRAARRPQYDWFFAGDGLIAANAAASAGNGSQARDELEFILRYQDKKTGMIWHEISQSAGFIDWAGKYPYMYVHVDITFQFLSTLAHYVTMTGDVQFVRDHWPAIAAAYHYCESVIDPATGLPRIPANKEGGDEQDRMSDDLGLSVSWVATTDAFRQLATLTGHADEVAEAEKANQRARASIPAHYWDAQNSFWISGHQESGRVVPEHRSTPGEAITMNLFTQEQNQLVLNQLASAAFQTDWGSRGVAAGSQGFDPTSYSKGSVSALGTTELASTFWSAHRPLQAFTLWSSVLPWTSLDSLGHIHEVSAGNVYRPQEESVPEQTWSSAGFLAATVHGLLGLEVDAPARKIIFAPRLPSAWHDLSMAHVPFADSQISFTLHQSSTEMDLRVDNTGAPFSLNFAPALSLGAVLEGAEVNHHAARAAVAQNPRDTVANVNIEVLHGSNEVRLILHGGISIIVTNPSPLLGEPSHGVRIIDISLVGNDLKITADIPVDRSSSIDMATDWPVVKAVGATVDGITPQLDRLTFRGLSDEANVDHYQRVEASVQFKR
jgi:glycogen debranching enzyme